MKQNKDWIEAMRRSLRDAEVPPPDGGWERLERALSDAAPAAATPARRSAWRIYWPRIAAAAAVVLIGTVAGELLLRPDAVLEQKGVVIATAEEGKAAADIPERMQERLQAPVEEPAAEVSRAGSGGAADVHLLAVAESRAAAHPRADEAAVVSDERSGAAAAEVVAAADTRAARVVESAPEERSERRTNAGTQRRAAHAAASVPHEPSREFRVQRPRRPLSFSLSAGGGVSSSAAAAGTSFRPAQMNVAPAGGMTSAIGNGTEIVLLKNYDYRESTFRHHQPLSFAVTFSKEFAYGLSLESGLNYTLLRSDVRAMFASDEAGQSLHFLGIPVRLNWRFLERGRFSLYVGAGGMVEKCISAKLGSRSYSEPGVQWSLLAAAGAQYRLGSMVGLYFEPEGSYYLTETRLETVRTDAPLTLTLRLGVRLSF